MRHYTALPAASPQVSSESACHSCGTRLISSVIKINEVLIAVATQANDCVAPAMRISSPSSQSEGKSGIRCVWEIQQHHSSSVAVVKNDDWDTAEPPNIKTFLFWSDLWPTALVYIWFLDWIFYFFFARVFICQTQIILDNGSSNHF